MCDRELNTEQIVEIQKKLGLSDGRMAAALGVTRQTWRNWRRGCTCPPFAQNALRWMMELRRLSPANDNLPDRIRQITALALVMLMPELLLAE